MKKDDVRVRIIAPKNVQEGIVYLGLVGSLGPALGVIEVLDDDGTWYSVAVVADKLPEEPRIIS